MLHFICNVENYIDCTAIGVVLRLTMIGQHDCKQVLTIVDLARGKMLFESGRLQRSKLVLDRFLRQQPNHFEGLTTRARVLAKLGSPAAAVNDFTRVIAQSPDPELYLERAETISRKGTHIAEALSGLDEGINRLGPILTLQLPAIELELRRQSYEGALSRLDEEARAAFNAALIAIESLPPARRQSKAVAALQVRARSALKLY